MKREITSEWPQTKFLCLLPHFCLRYTFVDILRAILLSLESMIEDPELQVNGFILIIDWSNFTFKQASKLTPSMLRLAIEGLQVRRSAVRRLLLMLLWSVSGQLMLETGFYIPRHLCCLFEPWLSSFLDRFRGFFDIRTFKRQIIVQLLISEHVLGFGL